MKKILFFIILIPLFCVGCASTLQPRVPNILTTTTTASSNNKQIPAETDLINKYLNQTDDWSTTAQNNTPIHVNKKTISTVNYTERYTIDATYPEIQGLTSQTAEQIINKKILDKVNANIVNFVRHVQSWKKEPTNDRHSTSSYGIYFRPVLISNQLVSLHFSDYWHVAGAATGNYDTSPFNYLVETQKEIKLNDFFKPQAPYLQTIASSSMAQVATDMDETIYLHYMSPLEKNYQDYIITPNGLLFFFPIAGAGPTITAVPWSKLLDVLNPNSPLATIWK